MSYYLNNILGELSGSNTWCLEPQAYYINFFNRMIIIQNHLFISSYYLWSIEVNIN